MNQDLYFALAAITVSLDNVVVELKKLNKAIEKQNDRRKVSQSGELGTVQVNPSIAGKEK